MKGVKIQTKVLAAFLLICALLHVVLRTFLSQFVLVTLVYVGSLCPMSPFYPNWKNSDERSIEERTLKLAILALFIIRCAGYTHLL